MGDIEQELPVPPKTLWVHLYKKGNVKECEFITKHNHLVVVFTDMQYYCEGEEDT